MSMLATTIWFATFLIMAQADNFYLPLNYDARNISAFEFMCDANLSVTFANGSRQVHCGTEIPFGPGNGDVQPIIQYKNAIPGVLYTLIMVDRDASKPWLPTNSPLIHFILINISAEQLQNGFNASNIGSATPLLNYKGPGPSAGNGCHRYYLMLYTQTPGVQPYLYVNILNLTTRLHWNFPLWATTYSLTKVSVNYFQTQNPTNSSGPCSAPTNVTTPSPPCPPPPTEVCCTRILKNKTTALTIETPFLATLSSVTVWVDGVAQTNVPAPSNGADPLAGFGLSLGSSDSLTGCALSAGALPNGPAPPGYQSIRVTCGGRGTLLSIVLPTALRGPAPGSSGIPPPPVVVKTCFLNQTLAESTPDASLLFRF